MNLAKTLSKRMWMWGFLAFVAMGCGKDDKGAAGGAGAGQAQASLKADAGKIWTDRCVRCHGKKGEGNGPDSASLDPKPRNFGDKEWQASVTDEHINKIILEGGAAVGKSATMPPNPDLTDKPELVAAVKDIVRAFGKK